MVTYRLVQCIAALFLSVTVAACSSTSVANVHQDPKAELQIWIRQAPDGPAAATARRLVKAFSARTGIKAKLVALLEDFETKLQQQAAQRQLPDIVINDTGQLGAMQVQGWLQQIDRVGFPGGERISEQAWKATRAIDGHNYAVPFSAQSFAIFVRRDWRTKLRLPEPRTWNDLATMAIEFTRSDPDGNGKADTFGLAIPGTTKRGYMSWYFSTYLWGNGGNYLDTQDGRRWRPAINNAPSVEAVTWLKDMFCKYKTVNPDAVNIDTPRAHDVFEKGVAGIYLTGPYMLPRFVKSMGSDKLEVIALPAGPSAQRPAALAEGENVYLMAGSRNRAGQRKFAEFVTSVEGQTIGMDGDNAGPIVRLPVNMDINMESIRKDPRWKTFQRIYDTSGVYTPSIPSWTPFRQTSAETLNAIMANCQSDVRREMDLLATQFAKELQRQHALSR